MGGRKVIKQSGIKKYVVKHLARRDGQPVYRIIAKSGAMSLKEFDAKQTAEGVVASPWGRRRVFRHAFILRKLGGHVFIRKGKARLPIKKLYGPVLANEMVRDKSLQEFNAVAKELPARLRHELAAILKGHAPR